MPYVFNLWNLYQTGEYSCEFDVTPADLPRIKDGTAEFIRACLAAFNVMNEPAGWSVTPFRSYYYAEYIESGRPWEGRWDIGWTVQVTLRLPLTNHRQRLSELPLDLDARDATWSYGEEDGRHNTKALVLSVHRDDVSRVEELARKIVNGKNGDLEVRSYQGGLHEIRRIFNDVEFPEWIPTGDAIVEALSEGGGWVNFRQLTI